MCSYAITKTTVLHTSSENRAEAAIPDTQLAVVLLRTITLWRRGPYCCEQEAFLS